MSHAALHYNAAIASKAAKEPRRQTKSFELDVYTREDDSRIKPIINVPQTLPNVLLAPDPVELTDEELNKDRFYDTWEMIKSLQLNQKAWLVNDHHSKTPVVRQGDGLFWETGDKVVDRPLTLGAGTLNEKWIIEIAYVDFMTAFTAYDQGKRVRPKSHPTHIYMKMGERQMQYAFTEDLIRDQWEVMD